MIDQRKITSQLSSFSCPTHHESAKFEVNGDKVSLSCCCGEFKERMIGLYKQELMKATKEALLKAFKG